MNLALDAAGELVYLAPTRVNLAHRGRWPDVRFAATREHAVRWSYERSGGFPRTRSGAATWLYADSPRWAGPIGNSLFKARQWLHSNANGS